MKLCQHKGATKMQLQVEYVDISTIKPYKGNAKEHPKEQIEQIKKSMQEFGVKDPIGIWHNEIVEGHGRYLALKELGETQVPVIRLDDLTDEQRKAYTLIHNQLTMNTGFDVEALESELASISDIDMSEYGFDIEKELGGGTGEVEEDDFDEEPPEEPISKLGDIYQLGRWVFCKKCGKKHWIS
jgi:ParB-like chromosome segregation protein Spo0J